MDGETVKRMLPTLRVISFLVPSGIERVVDTSHGASTSRPSRVCWEGGGGEGDVSST